MYHKTAMLLYSQIILHCNADFINNDFIDKTYSLRSVYLLQTET